MYSPILPTMVHSIRCRDRQSRIFFWSWSSISRWPPSLSDRKIRTWNKIEETWSALIETRKMQNPQILLKRVIRCVSLFLSNTFALQSIALENWTEKFRERWDSNPWLLCVKCCYCYCARQPKYFPRVEARTFSHVFKLWISGLVFSSAMVNYFLIRTRRSNLFSFGCCCKRIKSCLGRWKITGLCQKSCQLR